jgi:hypothetical protein
MFFYLNNQDLTCARDALLSRGNRVEKVLRSYS